MTLSNDAIYCRQCGEVLTFSAGYLECVRCRLASPITGHSDPMTSSALEQRLEHLRREIRRLQSQLPNIQAVPLEPAIFRNRRTIIPILIFIFAMVCGIVLRMPVMAIFGVAGIATVSMLRVYFVLQSAEAQLSEPSGADPKGRVAALRAEVERLEGQSTLWTA